MMTRNDVTRTLAALFCTAVMSATCVLGAIAPARTGGENPVAASRLVA